MEESSRVVAALGNNINLVSNLRFFSDSSFDMAVSYIWLGESDKAKFYLEKLSKIEMKKDEVYLYAGTADSLRAILEQDEAKLIHYLDQILYVHGHAARKSRYPLGERHYVCEAAICMLSRQLGSYILRRHYLTGLMLAALNRRD